MLCVVKLRVVIQHVILLSVVMLNVVMLSVMEPMEGSARIKQCEAPHV